MTFYVGVTDDAWYKYLAAREPDEVNFWRLGGHTGFRAVLAGAPFLFKLHSPHNFIVGGGFFVKFSFLPLSVAWLAFGEKNGTDTLDALAARIRAYRKPGDGGHDPVIACLVLTSPF